MALILMARHGNTFGPGDTPVWVGAREDLPLVESGEAQARALGEALRDAPLKPARILSGPLKRTRRAAEIIAELTGFDASIEIDERLKEIDYGNWGGKSDDQIIAEFGEAALSVWRDQHRRPPRADWSPPEDVLKADAAAVLADAAKGDAPALILTSNGVLRYMHAALEGPASDAKVKTGRLCAARFDGARGERILWNVPPGAEAVAALG